MPSEPTLSSMLLTSLVLVAPAPVISCIRVLTWFRESWPTVAIATRSTSRQPNPRPKRAEMDKDLKREELMVSFVACTAGVAGAVKPQQSPFGALWRLCGTLCVQSGCVSAGFAVATRAEV